MTDKRQWHAPLPIKLPRPTAWPVVVAAGISGFALGMVTHWLFLVGGLAVFAVGVVGWTYEMLQVDKEMQE